MNPNCFVLPSGPSEACKHAIVVSCAKHNAQLSKAGLILNLLSHQDFSGHLWNVSCLWHCHRTSWSVRPISSQDTLCLYLTLLPTHQRPVNQCCFIQVRLIKLTSNTGIQFKLWQPQSTVHFLLFNWSKMGQDSAAPYANRWWYGQAGRSRIGTHYMNISAFISHI
jgi:hypothetical protein